jgi:hypothetical protein
MNYARAQHHEHDPRPPLDLYQLGVVVAGMLASLRSRLERPVAARDTSIAWEDGETPIDERETSRRA